MNSPYLFVYGTLRRGFSNYYADMLHQRATFIGEASINARMFDIGGYPGITQSDVDEHIVVGDLFSSNTLNDLIPSLDIYEMCSPDFPHPQEYRKSLHEVTSTEGTFLAWVYFYNWDTSSLTEIPHGDYLSYISS